MDLNVLHRHPSNGAMHRASMGSVSPPSESESACGVINRGGANQSDGSSALPSPHAFHALATPSPPMLSVFSRGVGVFHRHDNDSHRGDSSVPSSPTSPPRSTTSSSHHLHRSLPRPTTVFSSYDEKCRSSQQYASMQHPSTPPPPSHRAPSTLHGSTISTPPPRACSSWCSLRMTSHRPCRRLRFWLSAVAVYLGCFALVQLVPWQLQSLAPVVLGALLSFVSSLTILVSYGLQPRNRRYPNELLVYVALCECGLALLALVHVLVFCTSPGPGMTSDTAATCRAMNFHACSLTTALEMFLLVASVGWFGCAIVNLFVSVSNPFANYRSQVRRYHAVVWGASLLLALLVPLVVFGGATQTRYDMSGAELCRAVALSFPLLPAVTEGDGETRAQRLAQWQSLTMAYWGVLFALVVALVLAAQLILVVGWWRSNSGTVIALKARRRMMTRMTTYVHTLNATWLVILVVFFWYRADDAALSHLADVSARTMRASSSTSVPTSTSISISASLSPVDAAPLPLNWLDAAFRFVLAAKGYFTCVVWLAVNKRCCALGAPPPRSTTRTRHGSDSDMECDSESDSDGSLRFSLGGGDGDGGGVAWALGASVSGDDHGLLSDDDDRKRDHEEQVSDHRAIHDPAADRDEQLPRSLTWNNGRSGTFLSSSLSLSLSSVSPTSSSHRTNPSPVTGATRPRSTSAPTRRTPTAPSSVCSSASSWASQNNATLQREIIYYTVCGITKAILRAAQHAEPTQSGVQQLMVGAARDSAVASSTLLANAHALDLVASPRAYCQPPPSRSFYYRSSSPRASGEDASSQSFARSFGVMSLHSAVSSSSSQQQQQQQQRYSMYPVSHVPFELFEEEIELQTHHGGGSPLFASLRRSTMASLKPSQQETHQQTQHHHHQQQQQQRASTTKRGKAAPPLLSTGSSVEDPRPKPFLDYAPAEFRAVRAAFGLSDEMYLASFRATAKERVSAGSSGAFMFFSGDNALIVKSMTDRECRTLVRMMPAYAAYVTAHASSRIIRFFGCHRIRLYGRNFFFVVMSNVLHSRSHTPTIREKYDVKGSWIDRQARQPVVGDRVTCSECHASYEYGRGDASTSFPLHVHRPDTILKDLDLTRPLAISKPVARALYVQLVADCEFLNAMGIMDYSVLIGVHSCNYAELPWQREFRTSMKYLSISGNSFREGLLHGDAAAAIAASSGEHLAPILEAGENPEEVYFVGIIDILQEWTWEKQLEKVGKMLLGKSSSGISAVAPDLYCERFKARLAQILRLDEHDEHYYGRASIGRRCSSVATSPRSLHGSCQTPTSNNRPGGSGMDEGQRHGKVERCETFSDDAEQQFETEALAVAMEMEEG